jgi:hypothetical protein
MANENPNAPAVTPIDPTQKIEQNAYIPTYKIKPDFKKALLQAIGDRPFNEIAGLIQAIDVEVMDHQTLTQIVNAIGQFPFIKVEQLMKNINNYIEQNLE